MFSKEEIEEAKEYLKEIIQNTYAEGKAIKLNNLLRYIEQLESGKQKLIEKLEKNIIEYRKEMENTNIKLNQIHFMKRIEYAKEILRIVKGEME